MKQVLFVTPRFFPVLGGFENYVGCLAKGLVDEGNKVSVFTTDAFDLEHFWVRGHRRVVSSYETHGSIEVRRFPVCHRRWLRRAGRLLGYFPYWRLKARFARPSFRVIGLTNALRHAAADVIHVGPLPYNHLMYYGIREAQRRGIRVLATPCAHFGEEANDLVASHYTQDFQIELLKQCDWVFALTEAERESLRRLGVPGSKLVLGSIGIKPADVSGGNAEAFRARWGVTGPIVLHLGMKALDKGSVCVVEAMKQLWREGNDVWLVLAGPSLSAFDEYLRLHNLGDTHLLNVGPVSDQQKRDLLAAADIVVQPSRVESFGIVYLEAWANRKPVIAADIAVTRELIEHGQDGLLVPFGDHEALAAAINLLLGNARGREEMGLRGQQKVHSRFLWSTIFASLSPYFTDTI